MRLLNKLQDDKATSLVEYAVLIMIIMGALFVFKDYIHRGMMGRWKASGDALGLGRQYDPQRTLDCVYDQDMNLWYEQGCYEQQRRSCVNDNQGCLNAVITTCSRVAESACQTN